MPRNILIFSDGTGQRGGVLVDERRSNIYKLYRATRCGPDSDINPQEQVAFYDPGIGTLPPGMGFLVGLGRSIYNLVSQALGLGLTKNIIDCYATVIRLWRPGDRIFLFGFSRGAYTARCLGAVISLCGVPTKDADGKPLKRDDATCLKLARRAVKSIYQHTSSWDVTKADQRQIELLAQRKELARRFRHEHACGTDDASNVYPYFIGVFDTVASLANPAASIVFSILGLLLVALVGSLIWLVTVPARDVGALLLISGGLVVAAAIISFCVSIAMRMKSEIGLPRRYPWRFFHLAERRMQFYDNQLNPNVGYARHAISIDEARDSFQRVRWGDPKAWRDTGKNEAGSKNPVWFEQLWFAGNHSDIGGSYPEDESRLSDVSLQWMLDAACRVGLKYDRSLLRLYPDPFGAQHDETRSSRVFRIAKKSARKILTDAPLHPSVIERFSADEVLQYDSFMPYRPSNLASHIKVTDYYKIQAPSAE